jgi:hypothetical protein
MCYSKDLSLTSLTFGIIASSALIFLGNKESSQTNKAIGYFYLFVTLMQLVEYFIWTDISCKIGLNKLASLAGPILNHLQPVVLLIFATVFIDSAGIIPIDTVIIPANVLYLLYTAYKYYKYVQNPANLCVQTNTCGHIDWTWKKDYNYLFYFAISFLNIVNFYTNTNLLVAFGLSYILLIISILKFNENIGEFWCLMVTGVPLVNLFMQRVLNINN